MFCFVIRVCVIRYSESAVCAIRGATGRRVEFALAASYRDVRLEVGTCRSGVGIPKADEYEISLPRTPRRKLPINEYTNNG